MSAAAITLVAGYLVTGPHAPYTVVDHGVVRQDEGAVAHLWQLLMVLQLPVIFYFVAKWLPKDTKRTLAMVLIQVLAFVAAALPVFLLEL